MSILKIQTTTKRQTVKMSLDAAIYQQIQSYCKWANLERPAEFVERAAEFIFMKDEKWKNRNRPAAKTTQATHKVAQPSAPQTTHQGSHQPTHKKPSSTLKARPSRKTAKPKLKSKHIA